MQQAQTIFSVVWQFRSEVFAILERSQDLKHLIRAEQLCQLIPPQSTKIKHGCIYHGSTIK